jgi:hypothetical protein
MCSWSRCWRFPSGWASHRRRAARRAAPLPRSARRNGRSPISTAAPAPPRCGSGSFATANGHSNREVGVSTASGANSDLQISSASPMPLTSLAIHAANNGGHHIIVSDGPSARLYTFAACRLPAVVDREGAPFVFDLQNLRGHGTGVACSDLGPPSIGRRLVGLQPLQTNTGQWTVRRTEIDLNGTAATIGPSDTVTATSARDPAAASAQTISCGDLTIGQDGVQQP